MWIRGDRKVASIVKKMFGAFKREKKEEVKGKFVLKKYTGRKWEVIGEYSEYRTPDDIVNEMDLEPGRYRLDQYFETGGFKTAWSIGIPDESGNIPGVEEQTRTVTLTSRSFKDVIKELLAMKEQMKDEYNMLKEFFEGKSLSEDDLLKLLDDMKRRYEMLDRIFGGEKVRSGEQPVYEGKIPMWLHPSVIPGLIERTLDNVERRLEKWGVISSEPVKTERIFKLPEKPRVFNVGEKEEEGSENEGNK